MGFVKRSKDVRKPQEGRGKEEGRVRQRERVVDLDANNISTVCARDEYKYDCKDAEGI